MIDLKVNRHFFSDAFWKIIFSNGSFVIDEIRKQVVAQHERFERLRDKADYNTGSISLSASVCLALLATYFRPRLIAEVGTFIGRSTYSLTLGRLSGELSPIIHTCDSSNSIDLNLDGGAAQVVQYPKKSSTEMFSALCSQSVLPEMYVVDGRIQKADLPLLRKLRAEQALIVLDDFEGFEKGVVNAELLLDAFKENYLLAYPPSSSFLASHQLNDPSTIAVLIPGQRLKFVSQG